MRVKEAIIQYGGLAIIIYSVVYVTVAVYYGFDKEHSSQMIPFHTALAASIIAFFTLRFVTLEKLHYRWKKDQTLRDIERIYEPIHEEISKIIPAMKTYEFMLPSDKGWSSLRTSHLGKILELKNSELYGKLESLYDFIATEKYRDNVTKGRGVVKEIVTKEIENRWHDENLNPEKGKDAVDKTLEILEGEDKVFIGFLRGLSMQEISKKRWGHEDNIINKIKKRLMDEVNHKYFNKPEYSSEIFDGLPKKVESSPEIQKIRKRHESFIKQAEEIKESLEKEIVKSQLR